MPPQWTQKSGDSAQQPDPITRIDLARRAGLNVWGLYLTVRAKFTVALALSAGWLAISIWMAGPWIRQLGELASTLLAVIIVAGIALVPGFINAFLAASLLLDRRPPRRPLNHFPGVTILVAAYDEAAATAETIESVARQNHVLPVERVV
jgi:biofilm PGA synthesis N-glycosyltransferase PgaC